MVTDSKEPTEVAQDYRNQKLDSSLMLSWLSKHDDQTFPFLVCRLCTVPAIAQPMHALTCLFLACRLRTVPAGCNL